jgi:hypothetical protein
MWYQRTGTPPITPLPAPSRLQIQIPPITTAQHAYATFDDAKGDFPQISTGTYTTWLNGTLTYNYSETQGNSGRQQDSLAQFNSFGCPGTTNAVSWQLPVNVAVRETMDGTTIYSFTDTLSGFSFTDPVPVNFPICNSTAVSMKETFGSDFAIDHQIDVDSIQYYDSANALLWSEQHIESRKLAGDVTYFSYGFQCDYRRSPSRTCNNPSDYYTWNSSGKSVYGTLVPVGTTWVPSIATKDAAGNSFSGTISVPLTTRQVTDSKPTTCYNYGPDAYGFSYQNCYSLFDNFTSTLGVTSY